MNTVLVVDDEKEIRDAIRMSGKKIEYFEENE